MDTRSYAQNSIAAFVRRNVCQSDKTLCKYLKEGNVRLFRTRLSKFSNADKKIEDAVMGIFVNYMKDMFMREISALTTVIMPLGFLILSGGIAINKYIPRPHKDVAVDIDLKFVPSVKGVQANSPKYFGYIQMAKLVLWYQVGRICRKFQSKKFIDNNFKDFVTKVRRTNVGKCLGIIVTNPTFKRRYTLIPKKKQKGGRAVTPNNVLLDIELFAIDMHGVKYYVPSKKKIEPVTLKGLVDIAIMRKGEVGGEVLKGTTTGFERFSKVFVAGKKYLADDIYMLKKLGLRPDKVAKDRARLLKFGKFVYKVQAEKTNSNTQVYKRISKKFTNKQQILQQKENISKNFISKISRLSPNHFSGYTTPIDREQISKYLKVTNLKSAPYKFNHRTMKWVRIANKSPYIKAEPMGSVKLYGYKPSRDAWIPKNILKHAQMIPLVGFKDKNLLM